MLPYVRVVDGKEQNVDGYWREIGGEALGLLDDLSRIEDTWGAYNAFAVGVGAPSIAGRTQVIRDASGDWSVVGAEDVSEEFKVKMRASIGAFQSNPRLFHLRSVFGDPTFSTGSRFVDGTPPGGTIAFEASGHVTLLEPEAHLPDVKEREPDLRGEGSFAWYGWDGTIRHEFAHRAMEVMFDADRPGGSGMAQGRSGSQLRQEWADVSGPYAAPFTIGGDGPVAALGAYASSSPREGFADVVALVTSPYYVEWKKKLDLMVRHSFGEEHDRLGALSNMVDWVERVVQP